MAIKHTEDFKQEAVRIALTSGLLRRLVASDFGVGFSTLGKWVSEYRPLDISTAPQADLAKENERLCHENRVLREERGIFKKGYPVLREPKAMRFGFVKDWRRVWPVGKLCQMMQVTHRGFRKWLARPMSDRQRGDMKVLAHIREHYGLSLGTYGRPRMTIQLKEAGFEVGERRVGRRGGRSLPPRPAAASRNCGSTQSPQC